MCPASEIGERATCRQRRKTALTGAGRASHHPLSSIDLSPAPPSQGNEKPATEEHMAGKMPRSSSVCLAAALISIAGVASADVFCKSPSGLLRLRSACKGRETALPIGISADGKTVLVSGANLQIVNGAGSSDGDPNGLGNLIVGYAADGRPDVGDGADIRTGSHNVVIGDEHTWSGTSGLVVGLDNAITGVGASVSGGIGNTASGDFSAVSGGQNGQATAIASSISGGLDNQASGARSSVVGGELNVAHERSTVVGGRYNEAAGAHAVVVGGDDNTASGGFSVVLGGSGVTAADPYQISP